jgi:hypothetical protein
MLLITPGTPAFTIVFFLTLIVILLKITLAISLGKKTMARKQSAGKFKLDLVSGIFIYMVLASLSRILFSIFDFVLTGFDTTKYVQFVWYWKCAMVISQVGVVVLLYLIDKSFFNFRLKGILAYLVAIVIIIQFVYPVNVHDDFEFVSSLTIFVVLGASLIPIMFLIIGRRSPEIRKDAYKIAFGIIMYSLAAIVLVESLLAPLTVQFGDIVQVFAFTIATLLKIIGLILLYQGTSSFKS